MAKKKTEVTKKPNEFDNIVNDSFRDGYTSDPEVTPREEAPKPAPKEEACINPAVKKEFFSILKNGGFAEAIKILSPDEKRILSRDLDGNDVELVEKIIGRKVRSTYYLTDLHRACIEVVAHTEVDMCINDVVVAALEQYFTKEVKEEARKRVVEMSIKKLEKEIP